MEWYWALLFLVGTVMVLMFLGVTVAVGFFQQRLCELVDVSRSRWSY